MKRKIDDVCEIELSKSKKTEIENLLPLELFTELPTELIFYTYDFLDNKTLSITRRLSKFSKIISDEVIKNRKIKNTIESINKLFSQVLLDHFRGKFYFNTSNNKERIEGEAKYILSPIFSLNVPSDFYTKLGEKVALHIHSSFLSTDLVSINERIMQVFHAYQLTNYSNVSLYVNSLLCELEKLLKGYDSSENIPLELYKVANNIKISQVNKNHPMDSSVNFYDYKMLLQFLHNRFQYYLSWIFLNKHSAQSTYLVYESEDDGGIGINQTVTDILKCLYPYEDKTLENLISSFIFFGVLRSNNETNQTATNFLACLYPYDDYVLKNLMIPNLFTLIPRELVFNLIDIYDYEDDKIIKKNILKSFKFLLENYILELTDKHYHAGINSSLTVFEYSIRFDIELTKVVINTFNSKHFFDKKLKNDYLARQSQYFLHMFNHKMNDQCNKTSFLINFKECLEIVKSVFSLSEIKHSILAELTKLETETPRANEPDIHTETLKNAIDFDDLFGSNDNDYSSLLNFN